MSLQPKNLGDHSQFSAYKELFQTLYHDPLRPIYDILGRRVDFRPDNLSDFGTQIDNAAHVCYGGQDRKWYREEFWLQKRAERIEWIEQALIAPARICHGYEIYSNEKYLLRVPRDEGDMEYFCVIAENKGKDAAGVKFMDFLTAYNIDWRTYNTYDAERPFVYSPQGVVRTNKKRGKKKKGQEVIS